MNLSKSAVESITEALTIPSKRTPGEEEYDKVVLACVLKPEGHKQKPLPDFVSSKRLYSVTTIAASKRYGGNRTPVVCDSFERAERIVLTNEGDICETSYHLVVVEGFICNYLYSSIAIHEQYWYVWEGDYETGSYRAIEIPEAYKGIIGWGIG